MRDYIISAIRTLVPAAWGTALAWLVSVGVLDNVVAAGPGATGVGGFLVTICIGVYYLVARLVEPHVPAWVAALLFGAPAAPSYRPPVESGGGDHELPDLG